MKKAIDQTLRDIKRGVNKTVLKVPSIEQKVLDATSNEPWGPHGSLLADIAQATRNYHEYQMIMAVLWKRINDIGKNWRHVYKALTVLEYMVAHGSERVIDDIKEHAYQISTLSDFQYIDSSGRDQGNNVRRKSQTLVALVNDKERIQEVREKAANNRDKFFMAGLAGAHLGLWDCSAAHLQWEECIDLVQEDMVMIAMKADMVEEMTTGMVVEEKEMMKGMGDMVIYITEREIVIEIMNLEEEVEVKMTTSMDQGVGALKESEIVPTMKMTVIHPEEVVLNQMINTLKEGGLSASFLNRISAVLRVMKKPLVFPKALLTVKGMEKYQSQQLLNCHLPLLVLMLPSHHCPSLMLLHNRLLPQTMLVQVKQQLKMVFQVIHICRLILLMNLIPVALFQAEMDLFGSLSDAFAPGLLAIAPASFGISDSTSSATLENTVPNQSFEDPFGDSPFKAFPSAEPAQSHNLTSTTSFQPSMTNLEHTKSSSSTQRFPDNAFPANASNMQIPPNQHFFLGEQSMQHNDVLAGILPPSAPVATSASQLDFPAPTGQQAFATSTPFPITPPHSPQNLTVQPGELTRHSSLPYFDTSMNSSTNIGLQPPNRMSSLPSDDLLGGWIRQSGSSSSKGSLALVPHQPSEKKFETKSTVWADTLDRGLVNLNISGSKINPLSNIGIDFESLNRKEKRMEKPSTTPATSAVSMGKAMGSGSGIGHAGAGVLRPAQNPMGPGMGMSGMNMGMGMARPGVGMGMGNYGTMNVNQQSMGMGGIGMGMGMNMNMGGMGMNMGMWQGVPMQPPHGLAPGSNMSNYSMAGRGGYPPQQTYQYGGGYR